MVSLAAFAAALLVAPELAAASAPSPAAPYITETTVIGPAYYLAY